MSHDAEEQRIEHPAYAMLFQGAHPFPDDMEEMIRRLAAINLVLIDGLGMSPFDWAQGTGLDQGREMLKELLLPSEMRMNRAQVASLVRVLKNVAKHPELSFGTVDIQAADTFLMGIRATLSAIFNVDRRLREKVTLDRGWKLRKATEQGMTGQMTQRGMTAAEVIAELVEIEIEILKRGGVDEASP